MLYIEMPGGVGFSTCDAMAGECSFTDESTADDNHTALLNWMVKFKDFDQHDLFISGESYAGVYVPTLVKNIWDHNQVEGQTYIFNLKGMIVGNGVTNWTYDTTPAFIETGFWHGLLDYDSYMSMKENKCDYSTLRFSGFEKLSQVCIDLYERFNMLTQDINTYDMIRECWSEKTGMELYS